MLTTKKKLVILVCMLGFIIGISFYFHLYKRSPISIPSNSPESSDVSVFENIQSPPAKPDGVTLVTPPISKVLSNDYHIYQTFNNCGPAALSMALSYFDIKVSQQVLGQALRPYQNAKGDNDDKSTTLQELAAEAEKYNLIAYHRPNGDVALLKKFITYDMPVITRTWLKLNDDIGHYRVVKGYDDATRVVIQDDSLQGKNLEYSYEEFDSLWGKFGNEYLVLVPKDKKDIAEAILGENLDSKVSWEIAVSNYKKKVELNPADVSLRLNLSVALFNVGDYEGSVKEFEQVEAKLPFRALWYQIEPIQAYFELKKYDRVLFLTDKILDNQNKAFSELYLLRGQVFLKQGQMDLAEQEFEKAVFYNNNMEAAMAVKTQ